MKVRNATIEDISSLALLFDQYRVFYRKQSDVEAAKSFLKERMTREESIVYVAEDEEGRLAGFVQLYPLFSSTRMKKLWLLNDLFVDPAYRGKQISVSLIERAKQLVKESGACGMFLETEISNVIGNNLYPRVNMQLNEGSNFYEWNVS